MHGFALSTPFASGQCLNCLLHMAVKDRDLALRVAQPLFDAVPCHVSLAFIFLKWAVQQPRPIRIRDTARFFLMSGYGCVVAESFFHGGYVHLPEDDASSTGMSLGRAHRLWRTRRRLGVDDVLPLVLPVDSNWDESVALRHSIRIWRARTWAVRQVLWRRGASFAWDCVARHAFGGSGVHDVVVQHHSALQSPDS